MHGNEYSLRQYVNSGDIEAVESLLKTKALDVNQKDQDGNTALHLAAKRTIDPISKSGKSMTSCLLDAGADFNAQNKEGNTPLHNAAWSGNLLATQLLLQKEADPFLQNNNHQTPRDLAEGAVERLLRVRTTEFPLHNSVRSGNKDDVKALLELKDEIEINKQDKGGRTPLHYAAEQADPAMVNVLIRDDKINLSLEDNNSMTPLDRSAFRGSAQTVKAILSSGVNPHTINTSGRAPLHYAASRGEPYTIKALIEEGADVNIVTQKNKKTPLHCAAAKGDVESVVFLLENEANADALDKDGRKPSSYTNNIEIRNILRSKEANVDVQCESRSTTDAPSISHMQLPTPTPGHTHSSSRTPSPSPRNSPSPQPRSSRSPSPRPENNSLPQPTLRRGDLRHLTGPTKSTEQNEYGSTPHRSASSPSPHPRSSRSPSPRPENNSLLQPTSSSSRAQLPPRTNMDISNAEQLPKSRGRE